MEEKNILIFGFREADPARDFEMRRLFIDEIEKTLEEGVSKINFIFCQVNKFNLRAFKIANALKSDYKEITTYFCFKYEDEENRRIVNEFNCDELLFNYDSPSFCFLDYELVRLCDTMIIQYFNDLDKRTKIHKWGKVFKKEVVLF